MAQPSLIAQCDRILISLGKVIGLIPVKLIDKMSLDHAGAKKVERPRAQLAVLH